MVSRFKRLISLALSLVVLAVVVCPREASAASILQIQRGTGDMMQWVESNAIDAPTPVTVRWSTNTAGATGMRWTVVNKAAPASILASGSSATIPAWPAYAAFTIPASAFAAPANSTQTFQIWLWPTTAAKVDLPPPVSVTVTEGPPGTVTFDSDLGSPYSSGPVEAGHPVAKFIAYKPLLVSGTNVVQLGRLVVEFSSKVPGETTKTVFVRIGDTKGVVQSTDPKLFVPPLKPGATFRVAIPLTRIQLAAAPSVNAEAEWHHRYNTGLAISIGTQIPGNPYVQYQTGVLTASADQCHGQGCADTSPPFVGLIRPGVGTIDANIAVGRHSILTGDAWNFDVFTKGSRETHSLVGTNLDPTTAVATLSIEGQGGANLFRTKWTGMSTDNLNVSLAPILTPVLCDPNNPAPRGSDGKIKRDSTGLTVSGCFNAVYDVREIFDPARNVFWITGHLRHQLARGGCILPTTRCAGANLEATRITLLAVSSVEQPALTWPADPFKINVVDNEYFDWPLMGVHGDYAIFHHLGDPGMQLRLYDADSLVSGTKKELGTPFTTDDFPGTSITVARHHGTTGGMTYLAVASGRDLYAYAFHSPHPTKGRPPLLKSNSYTDPSENIAKTDVVFHDGVLYVAGVSGSRVVLWKVPVAPAADKKSININSKSVRKFIVRDPGDSSLTLDGASVEVTSDGDAVVAFRAYKVGAPIKVEYAVLYHDESKFRTARTLPVSSDPLTADESTANFQRIDYATCALDPTDGRTVWLMSVDHAGAIAASVIP